MSVRVGCRMPVAKYTATANQKAAFRMSLVLLVLVLVLVLLALVLVLVLLVLELWKASLAPPLAPL